MGLCLWASLACSRAESSPSSAAAPRATTPTRASSDSKSPRASGARTRSPRDPLTAAALREVVEALASPACEGRGAGTPGDARARSIVEARMRDAGLSPVGGAWQHPFRFEGDEGDAVQTANVVGVLHGRDPTLAREVLVVGAHHDHLGRDGGRVFRGANDNATGVSVMLGVAEALARGGVPLRRTVAFVAFGGEEEGLHGSEAWVHAPPGELSMESTMFMLNLDMEGSWSSAERLYALHTFPATPGRVALDALAPAYADLRVALGEPGDDSDHMNFCAAGVPTTFFYTPEPRCYHQTCDVPERIEWASLSRIARLTRDLVLAVDRDPDLAARRAAGCRPRRPRRG